MVASVAHRPSRDEVPDLIIRFVNATSPSDVAVVAERLGASRDTRAIRPLLRRLGDTDPQDEPTVERSVCEALVALDVMRGSQDGGFHLLPRRCLSDDVVAIIHNLGPSIPWRYFDTQRV